MESLLADQHIRPMDFTNKPMKEFVYVAEQALNSEEKLLHFIELGLEHAKFKLAEL